LLVEQLWEDRSGVVSTQVLQELYVNLRRNVRVPLPAAEARRLVTDYLGWRLVVNGGPDVVEAAELEERFGVSYWDALILHAATTSGAATLYSEDLSHGRRYGTVRVINPFLDTAKG
jgi:predicted nucleic acid-binding protein